MKRSNLGLWFPLAAAAGMILGSCREDGANPADSHGDGTVQVAPRIHAAEGVLDSVDHVGIRMMLQAGATAAESTLFYKVDELDYSAGEVEIPRIPLNRGWSLTIAGWNDNGDTLWKGTWSGVLLSRDAFLADATDTLDISVRRVSPRPSFRLGDSTPAASWRPTPGERIVLRAQAGSHLGVQAPGTNVSCDTGDAGVDSVVITVPASEDSLVIQAVTCRQGRWTGQITRRSWLPLTKLERTPTAPTITWKGGKASISSDTTLLYRWTLKDSAGKILDSATLGKNDTTWTTSSSSTTLDSSIHYDLSFQACNQAGLCSPWTNKIDLFLPSHPGAVKDARLDSRTSSSLSYSWLRVAGRKYLVYIRKGDTIASPSDTAGCDRQILDSSFTEARAKLLLDGLAEGKRASICIFALPGGDSTAGLSKGVVLSGTTLILPPPGTPKDARLESRTDSTLVFSWSRVPGRRYLVYLRRDGSIADPSDTVGCDRSEVDSSRMDARATFRVNRLSGGDSGAICIFALPGGDSTGELSEGVVVRGVTVIPPPPGSPLDGRLDARTITSLGFSWLRVPGRSYRVYVRKGSAFANAADTVGSNKSDIAASTTDARATFSVTDLPWGGRGSILVFALPGGDSIGGTSTGLALSDTTAIPPAPGTPQDGRLDARTITSLGFSWLRVPGRSYRVYVRKGSVFASAADTVGCDKSDIAASTTDARAVFSVADLPWGGRGSISIFALPGGDSIGGTSKGVVLSDSTRVPPAPDTPLDGKLDSRTDTSLVFSWLRVSGRSYRVYVRKGSVFANAADTVGCDKSDIAASPTEARATFRVDSLAPQDSASLCVFALPGGDSTFGPSSGLVLRGATKIRPTITTLAWDQASSKVTWSGTKDASSAWTLTLSGNLVDSGTTVSTSWDTAMRHTGVTLLSGNTYTLAVRGCLDGVCGAAASTTISGDLGSLKSPTNAFLHMLGDSLVATWSSLNAGSIDSVIFSSQGTRIGAAVGIARRCAWLPSSGVLASRDSIVASVSSHLDGQSTTIPARSGLRLPGSMPVLEFSASSHDTGAGTTAITAPGAPWTLQAQWYDESQAIFQNLAGASVGSVRFPVKGTPAAPKSILRRRWVSAQDTSSFRIDTVMFSSYREVAYSDTGKVYPAFHTLTAIPKGMDAFLEIQKGVAGAWKQLGTKGAGDTLEFFRQDSFRVRLARTGLVSLPGPWIKVDVRGKMDEGVQTYDNIYMTARSGGTFSVSEFMRRGVYASFCAATSCTIYPSNPLSEVPVANFIRNGLDTLTFTVLNQSSTKQWLWTVFESDQPNCRNCSFISLGGRSFDAAIESGAQVQLRAVSSEAFFLTTSSSHPDAGKMLDPRYVKGITFMNSEFSQNTGLDLVLDYFEFK